MSTKTITIKYEVEVLKGAKVSTRICDFCRQSHRKILVRGTNNDDNDICGDCILQFADIVAKELKIKK